VDIRELAIPGAWEFSPAVHKDERGEFAEFYRYEALEQAAGHALTLRQGNLSVSSRGVVRGIHYALVPPGQAKYVMAVRGAFIDFVIDIRVGSPTFGQWDSLLIDDVDHRAVYLEEGLGHAIVALTDDATVSYLVSEVFNPDRELGLNILDERIGLKFPRDIGELVLSPKDQSAPTLDEALVDGLLPSWRVSRTLWSPDSEREEA